MNNVDHIGIAVRSIEEVLPFYTETLSLKCLGMEEVKSENVRVAFIDAGNIRLELLEPLNETCAIAKFLETRGQGIHHIAFGVNNIEDRMIDLKEKGIRMIQDVPKIGAHGAKVAFLHPKSGQGVLYELYDKEK